MEENEAAQEAQLEADATKAGSNQTRTLTLTLTRGLTPGRARRRKLPRSGHVPAW